MLISEKVLQKEFTASTMKKAYVDCMKWLSTNIIAVNNSKNVLYKIEKKENRNSVGRVLLTVYVSTDENEIFEHNCSICREMAGAFYNKENKYRCEVCKTPPYRNRLIDRLEKLKNGLKGTIL